MTGRVPRNLCKSISRTWSKNIKKARYTYATRNSSTIRIDLISCERGIESNENPLKLQGAIRESIEYAEHDDYESARLYHRFATSPNYLYDLLHVR